MITKLKKRLETCILSYCVQSVSLQQCLHYKRRTITELNWFVSKSKILVPVLKILGFIGLT